MSLSNKVELLDRLSRRQCVASVGRLYRINNSTVHYIRKNEKVIRESVVASAVPSTKVSTYVQDVHMERIEKILCMDGGQHAEEHAFKWASHSRKGDAHPHASGWH